MCIRDSPGLGLGLGGQGHVDSHLVAVAVGVEGGTHQGVQLDGAALHEHGLEGLNAQAVQGGGAVEHDGVVLDDKLQGVPHLGLALVHHLLGGLNVVGQAVLHQLPNCSSSNATYAIATRQTLLTVRE